MDLVRCRQGAGVAELLAAFDALGKQHEAMEADKFNDDGTYKAGINQVPRDATVGRGSVAGEGWATHPFPPRRLAAPG